MNKIKTYKVESIVKGLTYLTAFLTFAASFQKVSFFYYTLSFFIFSFSLFLEYKNTFVNRTLINILALTFTIFRSLFITFETLIETLMEILLFLLSLKFLEEKKFRDYMQIYLLSIIIFAGTTLISLEIIFLLYLFLYIILLNFSIIFLTYHSQERNLSFSKETLTKIFLKTGLIPLLAIPFTAFFFIILPRTDFPIFGFINKGFKAKTGFSDTVKLGAVSSIQEEDVVVFRAKMKKIDESSLYWRGIVFEVFNGKTWISLKSQSIFKGKTNFKNKKTIYQIIYLEPYGDRYLFGLDVPYKIVTSPGFSQNLIEKDFTYSLKTPILSRIKYKVYSYPSPYIPESIKKSLYLQLPSNISRNVKNLAKSLKGSTPEETIENILNFLKYGDYKYSLTNLPISSDPISDFLFKYKKGNCEYFASSMAILLRINGIPARVVGGYKGGIYNEIGGYYLVRQKDAHMWVEAFIDGKGWVRYDPTPYLTNLNFKPRLSKIALFWETINYYYINFILNYDIRKQLILAQKISSLVKPKQLNWRTFKNVFYFLLLLSFIILSVYLTSRLPKRKPLSPEIKLINEFLKILKTKGYSKRKEEGLEEFVSKIKDPQLREKALEFVKIFETFFYKDLSLSKSEIKKLKNLIKELKNLKN